MRATRIVPFLFIASLACGEPAGPGGPATPVALSINTVVVGDLAAGGSVRYRVRPPAPMALSVGVGSPQGGLRAVVSDSATGATLASGFAGGTSGSGITTDPVWVEPSQVVFVTVTETGGAHASFHLVVFRNADAPEARPASFAVGDTVVETIDGSRPDGYGGMLDMDDFVFPSTVDSQEVVVSAVRSGSSLLCTLSVAREGASLASGRLGFAAAENSELEAQTSAPFRLGSAGRYHATVQCHAELDQQPDVAYAFQIRTIDRRPEGRGASIVPGDTVDEAIAHKGDYDTYTLAVAPNSEIKLFLQSRGVVGGLQVQLSGPDIPPQVVSLGRADSVFVSRFVSEVRLPSAGPYVLEVGSGYSDGAPDRGGYRFLVYRVNRQPETAAPEIALGDTSAAETLPNGDIDEFHFTLSAPGFVNVELLRVGTATQPFQMEALGRVVTPADLGQLPLDRRGTGTLRLSAVTYPLRVRGDVVPEHPYTGSYRIHVVPVDTAPEGRGASIAIGDTVTGVLTPGDIDRYAFAGTAGQRVDVRLAIGADPARTGKLGLIVRSADPLVGMLGAVAGPASGGDPDTLRTYQFRLPVTGAYQVDVFPLASGADLDEYGSYRFVVKPYLTGPETVAAEVAVGDSIARERIDEPGDVDTFRIMGTPGQEIVVLVPNPLELEAVVAGDSLVRRRGETSDLGLGRLVIPASGFIPLSVWQLCFGWYTGPQCTGTVGPYLLWVYPVDRAPEGRSPTIAVGDSVAGKIERVGDVDEFTFSATAGDSLIASVTMDGPGDGVDLRVIGPGVSLPAWIRSGCAGCTFTWPFLIWETGTQRVQLQALSDRDALLQVLDQATLTCVGVMPPSTAPPPRGTAPRAWPLPAPARWPRCATPPPPAPPGRLRSTDR